MSVIKVSSAVYECVFYVCAGSGAFYCLMAELNGKTISFGWADDTLFWTLLCSETHSFFFFLENIAGIDSPLSCAADCYEFRSNALLVLKMIPSYLRYSKFQSTGEHCGFV